VAMMEGSACWPCSKFNHFRGPNGLFYGQDYVLRLMFANFNEINRFSLDIRSELSLCTNTGSVVEPTEPGSWQVEKYNSPMLASRQSKLQ